MLSSGGNLTRRVQILYGRNYKPLSKDTKKDLNREIKHIHGLEDMLF